MSTLLIVIGGRPGTGKTSLARGLARALDAVHLRIDTIEQALRSAMMGSDALGTAGYVVAYGVAADNLALGRTVVADAVNPRASIRAAWRDVARRAAVGVVEVEVVCSDAAEHRRRVESRSCGYSGARCSRPGTRSRRARMSAWDGDHLVIDTARRPVEQGVSALLRVPAGPRARRPLTDRQPGLPFTWGTGITLGVMLRVTSAAGAR